MATVTVRPDATSQYPSGWSLQGGSADADDALRDDTDATYLRGDENRCDATKAVIVGLANPTIPAGARIKQVRVRARIKDRHSNDETFAACYLRLNNVEAGRANNSGGVTSFREYAGAWQTQKPGGGEWTTTDLNNLTVSIYSCGEEDDSVGSDWAAVYVDVEYNELPVVVVTGPAEGATLTTTTKPDTTWNYADTEGDTQTQYRVKRFTAAQVAAGGFNPATSDAFEDSGWVNSSVNPGSHVWAKNLANGSYTDFAWVRHGGPWATPSESAGDSNQFTINVTPPPTPTLVVTPQASSYRHLVAVTIPSYSSNHRLTLEYSDDGGTTWNIVRGTNVATGVVVEVDGYATGSGSFSIYDREARPRLTRTYRARVNDVSNGLTGANSATATGIYTSDAWRVHVPSNPTLDITLKRDDSNFEFEGEEPGQANYAAGRRNAIVVKGDIQGENIPLVLLFESETEWEAFEAIRDLQEAVFLITDMDKSWWVTFLGRRGVTVDRTVAGVQPWWHTVSVMAIEQDRPETG